MGNFIRLNETKKLIKSEANFLLFFDKKNFQLSL